MILQSEHIGDNHIFPVISSHFAIIDLHTHIEDFGFLHDKVSPPLFVSERWLPLASFGWSGVTQK
jgi:hypothetical protein